MSVLKEPQLFDYLKEFHYQDLRFSEDGFAKYDCISDEHKLYAELKSRNTHYDDLLIEQIKYNALLEGAKFHNYNPIYISATPDGIWQFDLSQLPEPEWSERWLPRNTEFSNTGNKTKIVGYIHIKDGKLL